MRVGLLRVELRVAGCRSLKAKRRPLKSLIERLRTRHHVAVAEIDHQDKHQLAAIGVAVVSADGTHLSERLRAVREFIEMNPDCAVLDLQQEVVEGPDAYGVSLPDEYED